MPKKKKQILKGIDLFSGAGGMSLGAINAGISVILALDNNESAAETFKRNHKQTQFILGDIRSVNTSSIKDKDIFIVFGGPPCQGFSHSNTKTRTTENPNNSLYEEFLRFVKDIQPKWFLFENVEGIATFNNGETIKKIREDFKNLGYLTKDTVLYASDYGVPQHRNRFFMVGNRIGVDFSFPEKQDRTVTVADAISDLPDLNNGDQINRCPYKNIVNISNYAVLMRGKSSEATQNIVSRNKDYVIERYKHIKQGENWKAIPKDLMANYANTSNCHSGIYRRLLADKPAGVISNYRKNMLIHPLQDRGLSVREAARIQSFPDSFEFMGALTHIQQQIGNAVPPLLAETIFKQILRLTT